MFRIDFDVTLPCTGIPSRHQDKTAGGLLEAESQINVASTPGSNSSGSTLIFTASGATEMAYRREYYVCKPEKCLDRSRAWNTGILLQYRYSFGI